MHFMYAQKGIMKAAASQYAKTLSPALGSEFEKRFSELWDKNVNACNQLWAEVSGSVSKEFNNYYQWVGKVSDTSYDLFLNIDFSSRLTAETDFQQKLDRYEKLLSHGEHSQWAKLNLARYQNNIAEVFQSVCNSLF